MEDLYRLMLATSFYIVVFGMISHFTRNTLHLPDPVIAMIYGISIGPSVLNIFDLQSYDPSEIVFHFSRLVLSLQVMTISLQLQKDYVWKNRRSLLVLLIIGSILSCLVTFAILGLFTGFSFIECWAISAACTPTDPILSGSIMQGAFADEHIPERIRTLLTVESGLNDGVGIVLLYISLDLMRHFTKKHLFNYVFYTILWKTLFPMVLGYVLGNILSRAFVYFHSKRLVSKYSMTVFGIALSILCMCIAIKLDQSEFILIFFTGNAFSYREWFILETRGSQFQSIIENVFNISFFIFLGSQINWDSLNYKALLVGVLILLLRRPLVLLLLYRRIPQIRNRKESLLVGWFGPIGVGAIYYSSLADNILKITTINHVSLIVVLSVIIHGLTVPFYMMYSFFCPRDVLLEDINKINLANLQKDSKAVSG